MGWEETDVMHWISPDIQLYMKGRSMINMNTSGTFIGIKAFFFLQDFG